VLDILGADPYLETESFEDGNDFSETLTCDKFEELNVGLFRKTMIFPATLLFLLASHRCEHPCFD
jgi:hypothetical protein